MKVEIEDVSTHTKRIEVLIPKEAVEATADKIYDEMLKTVSIKGFRKGNAPRSVLRMYHGDYIRDELSKRLINENLEQAIKENDLFAVSMPEIENDPPKENEEFKFFAKFDVKPEITLEKYTGFELKKLKVNVEEDMIENVIKRFQEGYATTEDVKDSQYKISSGDYVVVDITSEDYPNINRENITIEAGKKGAIPGTDYAVMEMKVGDEKEIEVEFPKDHFMEEMRGNTANIKLAVKSIKHREVPKLDDAFAKKVRNDVETLEELRGVIKDELISRTEQDAKAKLVRDVIDKLLEANPIDVPESMVKMQAGMMLKDASQRLLAQGIKMQDVYPDASSLKDDYMKAADRTVRQSLLVEAIAKQKDIEASENDLDKEIETMAKRYNLSFEQMKKGLEEQGMIETIKFGIVEKKVLDYIIENSNVTQVDKLEENKDDTGTDSSGTN
ncbi:MAG: trigger factor [Deltaproteobacteria bacterium]|nr:trigger factor [Deltaproteobacteria bacterium]